MTPKNLDNPLSLNSNSNNFLNSTINNLNLKTNLNLHTINENSNQNPNEMYRIVLDDVIINS